VREKGGVPLLKILTPGCYGCLFQDKLAFNLRLGLACSASWVHHPEFLDLMHTDRIFLISVDPTGSPLTRIVSFFSPAWYRLFVRIYTRIGLRDCLINGEWAARGGWIEQN
jgi:hypothetical protein